MGIMYHLLFANIQIDADSKFKLNEICGLQLPRKPHQSTRLLQLTGR